MRISDLIKKIDIDLQKKPLLTKKQISKFVFFDKNNSAYIATIKNVNSVEFKAKYGIRNVEDAYIIEVYDKQNNYKQVSKAIFSVLNLKKHNQIYEMSSIYLSRIELLDKRFACKGIAKNMLKIIELFASNNNKKEICAFIVPYSFGSANPTGVYEFYEKMGFQDKSTISKKNQNYSGYKYLEPRKTAELKLSIINYPTENTNYTIIIPDHRIVLSHYKGVEKELL